MKFKLNNVREASFVLEELQQQELDCNQEIDQLVADFRSTHSDPPARITRVTGRVLAWRFKARTPRDQSTFTFTSERGRAFLSTLPPLVKKNYCAFERRRLDICARKRIVAYQIAVIIHWINARQSLRDFENTRTEK